MTDDKGFDLDAAFAALERDERAARPQPSRDLVARVLADAAEAAAAMPRAEAATAPAPSGGGWLRRFGFSDVWAATAAAGLALFLVAGFGFGYEAGPDLLAATGLTAAPSNQDIQLADASDVLFSTGDGF